VKTTITWHVKPEQWQAFLTKCPNATFFHTPGWYLAHAESLGYKLATAHVRFDDGQEALLPMATRRKFKGLVVEAMAGIETGYGGLVSPAVLSTEHVDTAYRAIMKRFPEMVITGNPHEAYHNLPSWLEADADSTQVVPLLPTEEQHKRLSKSRLKTVRRAQEEDYDLTIKTNLSVRDVDEFYACYAAHAAEWNYAKYVRDKAYFDALIRHGGHDLALFLAHHDGNLCGFRLLACYGPKVMALNVARSKRYEDWNVGPYLAMESMAWCFERGYTGMDLMPTGQLSSVKAYKGSFGSDTIPHGTATHTGALGSAMAGIRRALQTKRLEQAPAA
jgi:CelD/BcsL family acetyltransferase involved in cellulose biosynthesis